MKIARRIQNVQESLTLALTAKAKAMRAEGIDVIGFGAGEPDFDTPDPIKQRAIEEIQRGNTKYAPASGTVEMKKAVANQIRAELGLEYEPAQVIINIGAKHSLFEIFLTLVEEGDEVLIPAPYWLTYPEQVNMAGGTPVIMNTGIEQSFKINAAQLEAAITPKTVAIIINSPSNPTGMVYTRAEMQALADVLKRHPQVTIVSDEIYDKLIYGGKEHVSIATLDPELKERTLYVNGVSKSYSMTGWRLGWTAGPVDFIKAMGRLQSHSTSNPVSFTMPAAIVALESCASETVKMREAFDERRKEIVALLNAIDGVQCPEPMGAFYVFPQVSEHYKRFGVDGSIPFCEKMLEEAKVGCVPGGPFGDDACIRLSYATSPKNIREGLKRITEYLK